MIYDGYAESALYFLFFKINSLPVLFKNYAKIVDVVREAG